MRRFVGPELGDDAIRAIPDETTILNFRHLLEKHYLTNEIFENVKAYLQEKGLLLAGGSIIDVTIFTPLFNEKYDYVTVKYGKYLLILLKV